MEEVLEIHIDKLRQREDNDSVFREGNQRGRVDLLLSRVVQPRHDEHDNLVVELKRPSKSIDSKILNQIESYAIAVAKDPRFLKEKTQWKFIVVANTIDEYAKRKARQRDRPRGLVFDDGELNIQVWAYEWTEIIASAKARLSYINEALNYEADRETSRNYLEKVHDKYVPKFPQKENDNVGDEATEG